VLAWEGKQVQDALIRWVYEGGAAARPATRIAQQPGLDKEKPSTHGQVMPSG
jgi:hypothetical protein